jgi:hypothetical protein
MSLLPLNDPVYSRTDFVNNRRTQIDDATGTKHLSIDGDGGLDIRYDVGTSNVKNFKISSAGVNWADNTNNHTTGLERLALVQTAFQAVELPPNATTLKINDTLLLDDGSTTTATLNESGLNIADTLNSITAGLGIASGLVLTNTNVPDTNLSLTANNLTFNDTSVIPSPNYLSLDIANGLEITDYANQKGCSLTTSGLTFTDIANSNTLTIDDTTITHSNTTNPLGITSTNGDINLTADITATGKINVNAFNGIVVNRQGVTPPDTIITSIDGNAIEIFDDQSTTTGIVNQVLIDPNGGLFTDNTDNTLQTQSFFRGAPTYMEIYDHTSSGTNTSRIVVNNNSLDYYSSGTKPSHFQFAVGSASIFRYNTTGIRMGGGGNGVHINLNNIKYPTTYHTAQASLSNTSDAVHTFNISVAPFGAILPNATATNVGTQFIITNVNANSLGVTTTGGTQLIYSATGAPSSVSRQLAEGNSRIFTAIQTTGASTYGWSMV